MSAGRMINWTLAGIIAAILSTSYLLDSPTDTQSAQASSLSLQDALAAAKAEQLRANATKVAGVAL